ncbi:MAG: zinc finger domain-containing protein [Solirubrobacteraceae bacterium]
MSRDASQTQRSDRRSWLEDDCPSCGARAGARCQSRVGRKPPLTLHGARGWRQRRCPVCKAAPGERCATPRGRPAAAPHTARLHCARGELHAAEDVWRALQRAGAQLALVRFTGGGGRPGTLEGVSLQAQGSPAARPVDEIQSELTGALAAPVWGRYGSFRGQPLIAATLRWSVVERSLLLAGTRGTERFQETLQHAVAPAIAPAIVRAPGDTSRDTSSWTISPEEPVHPQLCARACQRCGQPIAASARAEACYCSKRCRQAASRARLREQSGRSALAGPERCALCEGPMPAGLRPEACYCSKRCRQAASRARLRLAHRSAHSTA